MNSRALVITDLDGTFVYDSNTVQPGDKAAFHQLQKRFFVGIATGRSPKEVAYVERIGDLKADCKVCFNGAIVEDRYGDRLVDEPIPSPKLRELLAYLKAKRLIFDALDGNHRMGNYQVSDVGRLWGMKLFYKEDPFEIVAAATIYKINVRPEPDRFRETYRAMRSIFRGLSLFESEGQRIEITAANTGKGRAVQMLRRHFTGSVIGVGNSGNDIPLFEAADQAYCMMDAPEPIRTAADITINRFADLLRYEEMIGAVQNYSQRLG